MKYVSTSLYRKMIGQAREEGLDASILAQLLKPLSGSVKAVAASEFFALHETLEHHFGPGFAVRVGASMRLEDYGVLGLSWKTCSWAGEIFDRWERYFRLLSDTYAFSVEKGARESQVILLRQADRRGIELSNEATIAATVTVMRQITQVQFSPTRVGFRHGYPLDDASHEEIFRCPLEFSAPRTYIAYRTADLERRTASADAEINRFLLERVREEEAGVLMGKNLIIRDVENLIRAALPSGIPQLNHVGRTMGMSGRTLMRRLSEHGLTFRALTEQVQLDLSRQLLRDTTHNISEIAFETGFSEQSAFTRAFKRWTGQTPVQFRRAY